MSRRADHLAEMRYAVEHRCSLAEAKAGLARLRWLATQHRIADRQNVAPAAPQTAEAQPQFWWQRD